MAALSSNPLSLAIREFQGSLTREENAALLAHSTAGLDATGVLAFTAEIDRVNATRRSRCVSSRLFGILQSVQEFSGVVDTFVSSHPEIAALVWGSVKFALLAINNAVSFFDRLSQIFLRLGEYCPRYVEYRLLFADSARLRKALCSFYATIVRFCTKAMSALRAPGPTILQALWRPFEKEFGEFETDLRTQGKEIKEEIWLAGEQAAAVERALASRERLAGKQFREQVQLANEDQEQKRIKRAKERAVAERMKLIDRLSTYDYVGALKRLRKKRYRNTASWFGSSRVFNEWLYGDKPRLLCLTGILGSGKSVVTAAALDEAFQKPRESMSHIAFFFCERDFADSMNATTILGTLIRQCLSVETLGQRLEAHLKSVLEASHLDVEDLEPLLQEVVSQSQMTTIVIDGLDSCSAEDKILVVGIISRLISPFQSKARVMLSCREGMVEEIRKTIPIFKKINMSCSDAQNDIPTYIEWITNERLTNGSLAISDPQLVDEIKEALSRGADGMFLWVMLQVNSICQQICDSDIRKCINTLPKGLPETYQRIISQIDSEGQAKIVHRIFQWIAVTKRPFTLGELREAISIEPEDRFLHKDRLVNQIEHIASWCGDLVTLDEDDHLVQFAHPSVIDFLLLDDTESTCGATQQTYGIRYEDADNAAGIACITYLNFNDFNRQVIKGSQATTCYATIQPVELATSAIVQSKPALAKYGKILTKVIGSSKEIDLNNISDMRADQTPSSMDSVHAEYAFLRYAQEHWLSHTKSFTPATSTKAWKSWKRLVLNELPIVTPFWDLIKEEKDAVKSIENYIITSGHVALFKFLINNSPTLAPTNIAAIFRRNITLYSFLRSAARYETCHPSKSLPGALLAAVLEKMCKSSKIIAHWEMEAILLAAMETRLGSIPWKLLGKAFTDVINDLVHVELPDDRQSVLPTVFNVLIIQRKFTGTIFQAACLVGFNKAVKLLLSLGADVNTQASELDGLTALQCAAKSGHFDVVETLLDAGADINAPPSRYGLTAVEAAAVGGHLQVLGQIGWMTDREKHARAVQLAVVEGHSGVVDILLQWGVPSDGVDGYKPLECAAEKGHLDIVKCLLFSGADINGMGHFNSTALHAAARKGHLAVVDCLLAAGVDAWLWDSHGLTAFHYAKKEGHWEIANSLREYQGLGDMDLMQKSVAPPPLDPGDSSILVRIDYDFEVTDIVDDAIDLM